MDDETSISSSGPGIPTPSSSTRSSPPRVLELILPPPGDPTDLRTLESARESVAWLAGQIVYAIERVLHDRAAGTRARIYDTWVINEAGRLMARLVPHMEGTSGAFSLDGGQLLVDPYPGWPMPRPAGGDDETDPSAAAWRRMEEFSAAVGRELESTKKKQRQRHRSSQVDFEDEIIRSLVPNKKRKKQMQKTQKTQWHRPLVVNGSTPYQTTTEAASSAATGGIHPPDQLRLLQEQQELPLYDRFGMLSAEHEDTPARPSLRATSPPMTTTSGAASPSSTSASPSHSTIHAPRIVAPNNTPTTRAPPSSRWSPPPQFAMSPPSSLYEFELRPRRQPTQPPLPTPREQHLPAVPWLSTTLTRSLLTAQSREEYERLALQVEPPIAYLPWPTPAEMHDTVAVHDRGPPFAPRDTRNPFYGSEEPEMLPPYDSDLYDALKIGMPYGSSPSAFYDSAP